MTTPRLLSFVMLVATIGICSRAQAAIVIDQMTSGSNTVEFGGTGNTFQQQVTAGTAGKLVGVDLWFSLSNNPAKVSVNKGTGWQADTNDFMTTVSNPFNETTWTYVDVSAANLMLTLGDKFVIGLTNGADFYGRGPAAYSGNLYLNGSWYPGYTMAFRTYVDNAPAIVPEPGTIVVWSLIGLIGVVWVRRRTV